MAEMIHEDYQLKYAKSRVYRQIPVVWAVEAGQCAKSRQPLLPRRPFVIIFPLAHRVPSECEFLRDRAASPEPYNSKQPRAGCRGMAVVGAYRQPARAGFWTGRHQQRQSKSCNAPRIWLITI